MYEIDAFPISNARAGIPIPNRFVRGGILRKSEMRHSGGGPSSSDEGFVVSNRREVGTQTTKCYEIVGDGQTYISKECFD